MKTLPKFLILFLATTLWISCSSEDENAGCSNCDYILASGDQTATTDSITHGTHNLSMKYAKASSPFPDGTKATFTISATELKVEIEGKECVTLKNPIKSSPNNPNSTEVRFVDNCRDNLKYDVSLSNNGGLNEINISNNTEWIGQFNDQ